LCSKPIHALLDEDFANDEKESRKSQTHKKIVRKKKVSKAKEVLSSGSSSDSSGDDDEQEVAQSRWAGKGRAIEQPESAGESDDNSANGKHGLL